jgi:hypothetical protein
MAHSLEWFDREDRLIGRQFDGDIQISVRDTKRVEGLDEGGRRSGAVFSQNSFARGQIIDREFLPGHPRVLGAHDHDEIIPGHHFDCEAGIPEFFFGTFDKAEFDVAADYSLDDRSRVSDGNHQGHAGIGLAKVDQSWWQEMTRHRVGRGIALTEGGKLLLDEARALVNRAEAVKLAMREFTGLARGRLAIKASQTNITRVQGRDQSARLSHRTTRSVKIIGAAAIALLASANTFANAAENSSRLA